MSLFGDAFFSDFFLTNHTNWSHFIFATMFFKKKVLSGFYQLLLPLFSKQKHKTFVFKTFLFFTWDWQFFFVLSKCSQDLLWFLFALRILAIECFNCCFFWLPLLFWGTKNGWMATVYFLVRILYTFQNCSWWFNLMKNRCWKVSLWCLAC